MIRVILALALLFPTIATADGTLYISPQKGTYSLGETFSVRVLADTGGQKINAAEAELDFDPRALAVVSISTVGSILSSWSTEPSFSNTDGTIEFSGWAEKQFSGQGGLLVTITFKALRSMSGNARFAAGAILAADCRGSNIIANMRSGTFTIRAGSPPPPSFTQPVKVADSQTSQKSAAAPENDQQTNVPEVEPQLGPDGIQIPDAPSLAEYPRDVLVGERIYLKGTADPNTPVKVYLQYGDFSADTENVMTSSDGTFTYASEVIMRPGVYHLWAKEFRGSTESEPTRTVKIDARASGYTASAHEAAALLEAMIPFFAFLALFGLSVGYFLHRRTTPTFLGDHIV